MNSKGYALARAELIRVLTAYSGITTENGALDGTTLVDANLKDNPSISEYAIPEKTILIMSGDAIMEDKGAASFVNATGTITLQGTGFSAQIKVGTIFRILNISSVELDVADIGTKIGTNVDPAGTTTLFAWLAKIFAAADVAAIEAKLDSPAHGLAAIIATLAAVDAKLVDPATGLAAIINTIVYYGNKLDDPATGLTAIINTLAAHWNLFVDPAVGFAALANTLAAILEDTSTTLEDKLDAIAAYVDTEVSAIEGKLDDGTTGLAALKALIDAIEAKVEEVYKEQIPDVDFSIAPDATLTTDPPSADAENSVVDIDQVASQTFVLRSLWVNITDLGTDPNGGAKMTFKLWVPVNGTVTEVDSVDVTATGIQNLMDLFGLPEVHADGIWITAQTGAGTGAVEGTYNWAKAIT